MVSLIDHFSGELLLAYEHKHTRRIDLCFDAIPSIVNTIHLDPFVSIPEEDGQRINAHAGWDCEGNGHLAADIVYILVICSNIQSKTRTIYPPIWQRAGQA